MQRPCYVPWLTVVLFLVTHMPEAYSLLGRVPVCVWSGLLVLGNGSVSFKTKSRSSCPSTAIDSRGNPQGPWGLPGAEHGGWPQGWSLTLLTQPGSILTVWGGARSGVSRVSSAFPVLAPGSGAFPAPPSLWCPGTGTLRHSHQNRPVLSEPAWNRGAAPADAPLA